MTGDATSGAAVYANAACAQCHTIDGRGGFLGPDLSDIGARRAVRHLRQSVAEPNADIAARLPSRYGDRLKGTTTSGIHLNEDDTPFISAISAGNLRSFMKRDLKGMTLPRQSLMPAYPALPATDLENLVAYLASLKPSRARRRASRRRQPCGRSIRLDNIGGHKTTVLGQPKIIDSPIGKAVEFDGVDDALVIDSHPLAGATAFTWEAVFRPDGGETQQRWFHLSEQDPATGADTDSRMLFEIRVVGNEWYLDSHWQRAPRSRR